MSLSSEVVNNRIIDASCKIGWLIENGCISINTDHLSPEHKKAAIGYVGAIHDVKDALAHKWELDR